MEKYKPSEESLKFTTRVYMVYSGINKEEK